MCGDRLTLSLSPVYSEPITVLFSLVPAFFLLEWIFDDGGGGGGERAIFVQICLSVTNQSDRRENESIRIIHTHTSLSILQTSV